MFACNIFLLIFFDLKKFAVLSFEFLEFNYFFFLLFCKYYPSVNYRIRLLTWDCEPFANCNDISASQKIYRYIELMVINTIDNAIDGFHDSSVGQYIDK